MGKGHEGQENGGSCARVFNDDWVDIIGRVAWSDEDVESNASFPESTNLDIKAIDGQERLIRHKIG